MKKLLLLSCVLFGNLFALSDDEVAHPANQGTADTAPTQQQATGQENLYEAADGQGDVVKDELLWLINQLPEKQGQDLVDDEQDRMSDEQLLSQYVELMRRLSRLEKDFSRAERLNRKDSYVIVQYLRKERTRMRHLITALQAKSKLPLPQMIDDLDTDEFEGMSLKQWALIGTGCATVAGLVSLSLINPDDSQWTCQPKVQNLIGNFKRIGVAINAAILG